MHRPIGVKFCMIISSRPNFIMPVQNFGGPCAPKFSHTLENDQVLLVYLPLETGVSLTIFFKGGSKILSKFDISVSVAFGVKEVPYETLPHDGP